LGLVGGLVIIPQKGRKGLIRFKFWEETHSLKGKGVKKVLIWDLFLLWKGFFQGRKELRGGIKLFQTIPNFFLNKRN